MELHAAVQLFAVVHLATMGLSHIVAHRAWAEFFVALKQKGRPGVFLVGMMSLGFGSIIAAFHQVWSGIPLVLTLLGWSQVAKGLVYMVRPEVGLRSLERVSLERSRMFIPPGVVFLALAGLLAFHLLR